MHTLFASRLILVTACVAAVLPGVTFTSRAATSISGVYQVQATTNACAFQSPSCVLTFKKTPAEHAIAAHAVSCNMALNYNISFITPPATFSSLVLQTAPNDESIFLIPQITDFSVTGGNNTGQVEGVFYVTANYNGTFYLEPGVSPTVTLTINAGQAPAFGSGTMTCTISGKLILP